MAALPDLAVKAASAAEAVVLMLVGTALDQAEFTEALEESRSMDIGFPDQFS
jgi:hypothetical protein